MSTTIDQRVVEMQFDNKHFERNVSTTLSTLDKLKQSLNLPNASKSLENVGTAVKGINMAGLGSAVETVQAKFSALGVIGVTALANITNSAVNTGKRLISALTIDPIKTGFQEYETQIGAVQTILANTESKGTTLQDVNRALDTLNTYADKTIYNFTEMTRNIGTFTAAGVDLDTSVKSIQGIANLAAVSGSTSQQASTAMYQLSQALAAGKVSLMDWNSVVNAGMGGEVFQNALKRTAESMGTNVDAIIEKYGSFRESLTQGEWLTTDVLTKTLEQFTMAAEEGSEQWERYKKSLMDDGYTADQAEEILKMANTATDAATKVKTFTQLWDTLKESAQSGWTQTWEILIGDFEEAKEFLTNISDTIGPMISAAAEARNELLSGGLSTGWDQLLNQGIADEEGYKDAIKSVAKEHGVAIDEMIEKEGSFDAALKKGLEDGSISSDMLSQSVTVLADKIRGMSEEEREAAGYTQEHLVQIEALEAGLKDGSISMEEFTEKMMKPSGRENLIEALWNSFNALLSVIKPIKEAFREIFPPATAEQLYTLTERIRDFTAKLTLSGTNSENLKRTFKGLFAVLHIVAQAVKALFGGFVDLVGIVAPAGGGILAFTAKIGDYLVSLDKAVEKSGIFTDIIEKLGAFLKPVADGIKKFANAIKTSFSGVSDTAVERLGPLVALGNIIKTIFVEIGKAISKAFPSLSKIVSGLSSGLGSLIEGISSAVQNADYDKLFDILNGGIFATIGIGIAKFFKSAGDIMGNSNGFLENITNILEGVGDSFEAFTQQLKAKTLLIIAGAIALLAGSLIALSLVDSDKLTVALGAITIMFVELMAAMSIFSNIAGGIGGKGMIGMLVISKSMTSMATAMLILAAAMKVMSSLSWDELARGLVGTVGGLAAFVAAVNLLPEKKVNSAAKAIAKMSTALLIFSVAMKIMSSLSWDELARGLVGTVAGLAAMVAAVRLLPKGLKLQAAAILVLSASMVILAGALKIMATMSWTEIGKGLLALAGSLAAITIAVKLMPKSLPLMGAGLLIVAAALVILSGALRVMATMSWEEIAKGLVTLGGSLAIIAIGVNAMRGALLGAAALAIVAASILLLTPALKALGSMSLAEIGKSLLMLAGAFAVIGIAGLLLQPLVPTLLALSATLVLFGVGCVAVGAGIALFATGISVLVTALSVGAGAIVGFVTSMIGLIPYLIEQIGIGIIKFCEVISGSASAICEAITVIVKAVVQALVECTPEIVNGIFVIVDSLLDSLIEYGPTIVGKLFDFLIQIIDMLAAKLPDLIQAGVNLIMSLFEGIVDALKNIDPGVLVNGILAIGAITALMFAMSAIAGLIPSAMIGVLGAGLVVAELALVLAAIGGLAQIPGLSWLVEEGGNFLQKIGTALGQFIGGIVGGVAKGITSALPDIGTDLSDFMSNVQPFIEGAKQIDSSVLDGVKNLAGVIIALTGANLIESLTSWLTGGSSLADFGAEIAEFAPYIKQYADTVTGIDAAAIEASATAAKALSGLANNLPNSGGLAGLLAGENDIGAFGAQLVPFGEGLKAYAQSVTGIDAQAVTDSATAAKALADMSNYIPNEGGMVAWFTGENSIANFGSELVLLGEGLQGYALAIAGIDTEAITASASAAKALADMVSTIPNEGGVVAWFAGENSVAKFGTDLIWLGQGLKGFSEEIVGIVPENMIAAANAAKALAEMTTYIPNEGGLLAWFAGENSVAKFSTDLIWLGQGLRGFSNEIVGIVPDNIVAAANAAKALAEMTSYIPNEGGMVAWFTGENSLARFSAQLVLLGMGLKSFSNETAGIVPENVTAAANAAKALAEMANTIPNEGGIKAWFVGENSVSKFADQLPKLGEGLKGFSSEVEGIVPENVTAAANAAKALAEMANTIPNEGGIKAWFTGENSVSEFADKLPTLGEGLLDFSDSVEGIVPENVTAAANAAESLGKMASTVPKDTDRIVDFGDNLDDFGSSLSKYFENTSDISTESITATNKAIDSITKAAGTDSSNLDNLANAITDVVDAMTDLSKIDTTLASDFKKALTELGATGVESLLKPFEEMDTEMKTAAEEALNAFISAVKSKLTSAKSACTSLVSKCVKAIKDKKSSFKSAGKYLGKGLVEGIEAMETAAYNAGYALGQAAVQGEQDGQQSESPSKATIQSGKWLGEGLVIGINKMKNAVYKSASSMGERATSGISNAVATVSNAINSDIDVQPTIRPVVDLSDVRSGASLISDLFGNSSVGVMANVGTISTMMNRRNQNGANDDVVNAIEKLRSDVGNIHGDQYNINGITYDPGSALEEAINTIIRYAQIERRV